MAKLRMNHSRKGRGSGSNLIRMFAVVFFLLIIFFLVMGRKQLSNRLDHSILFDSQEEDRINDSLLLSFFDEVNLLLNPHLGIDSMALNKRFAYLPSCQVLQEDSIYFNAMYFIPTEWLSGLRTSDRLGFFGSKNLSGLEFESKAVVNPFAGIGADCSGAFVEIIKQDRTLLYNFKLSNEVNMTLVEDTILVRF